MRHERQAEMLACTVGLPRMETPAGKAAVRESSPCSLLRRIAEPQSSAITGLVDRGMEPDNNYPGCAEKHASA